ncbi:MAG TPA: hypothetical protein VFT71_03520 [Candidatus Nitrosocosmicus sp.]|nr:hypothetical protein [Candidatus Nitrosocosmicus sp.]
MKSPWHSSKFDVMAENVTNPSAQEPVASFEVRIEGRIYYLESVKNYKFFLRISFLNDVSESTSKLKMASLDLV